MNKSLLSILGITLCTFLNAQISVDQSYTIEEYVNEVLLGTGIDATNISFTGSELQIGYMEGAADTPFPLNSGIILSTEHAGNVIVGINNLVPQGETTSGEPDLLEVANSVPPLIGQSFSIFDIHDVCILEFDLVASENTLVFNYSFGSDEYLAFINSSFNDVFAFFLSGPGINGSYASPANFPNGAINIAGVPDSDPNLPITVSSVNDVLNGEYYINNPSNDGFAINGCTIPFTVTYPLITGETYHMKFAIADGSDSALESIVALEAGSFSALPLSIEESSNIIPSLSIYPNPSNGNIIVSVSNSTSSESKFQMIDLSGRVVFEKAITSSSQRMEFGINCSHLSKGSYIAVITNGHQTVRENVLLD